jgi:hypothetical protein
MSIESSKALKKLALSIKAMTTSSTAESHILNAITAADNLKLVLKTNPWQGDVLEIIPVATVASLLIEVVSCTVKIKESVHELASLAKFNTSNEASKSEETNDDIIRRIPSIESHNISIDSAE